MSKVEFYCDIFTREVRMSCSFMEVGEEAFAEWRKNKVDL